MAYRHSARYNISVQAAVWMLREGGIMRIETLYEFTQLCTSLNFTETAKSFFISQSVLSNHIAQLEKELGVRLFIRDNRSVQVTEAGELFLESAHAIIDDYEQALSRIQLFRKGVSTLIRVGFLLGSFGSFLPLICRRYQIEHPEVEFAFSELDIGRMMNAVNNDRVDIGFTLFSHKLQGSEYECRCLYEDCYKLAVPKTHRLAGRTSIAMEDLADETVVAPRFNPERGTIADSVVFLRNAGVKVQRDPRITDAASLMASVVATNNVALAFDNLALYGKGNLEFLPIKGEDLSVCAGPIWKRSNENEVIVNFIDYLQRETRGWTKRDFLPASE